MRPPDTGLPVERSVAEVRAALADVGSAVLRAPPGAGKTTVVPLRLLDEPWLGGRRIVVLEPRRLAARAAAARMASLLGEPVGATVGYSTRDERVTGQATRIEVVTEGILTRRLQHDRSLPGVGLVVFDEVHERNLQTDLALALALDARAVVRPDLRLLAMSATVETERVAAALGVASAFVSGPACVARTPRPAPVVESQGTQHPVEVRWVPPPKRERPADAVVRVTLRALREGEGDVLVFLAGAGDIRRVEAALARSGLPDDVDVRPLFGALPVAEQDLALAAAPPGRRRVVLATDIAETSLTVEGVRIVVDSGESRTPRYDPRTGLTRLQTGPISRASAEQRTGRAGRLGPGTAYRLWSKLEHAARRPFPAPEIASVDLAGLALELAVWGGNAASLTFLDPPPARALDEGRRLLQALDALDGDGQVTPEGRAMAELPLHPRLARMVTGGLSAGTGWTACVLGALLEDRDVLRGRPDDVPVDIAERVRLVVDRGARHPVADGPAVGSARRRAIELARRVGVVVGGPAGGTASADLAECGRVLALAYPDRIAQARGGGRFRLRNGMGAWAPTADPLAAAPFLVVAELDVDRRDSRVRVAAALDPSDLEAAAAAPVESSAEVRWDAERGDVRATVSRRIDGLVLSAEDRPAEGPDAVAALVEQVRASGLGLLRWTDDARGLQQRVGFLRQELGDSWPDLSDTALLASLDEWLVPLLGGGSRRVDLRRVDLGRVLRQRLTARQRVQLDELAPSTITTAAGQMLRVDYGTGRPTAAAKVQDLFGTTRHPTVVGGKVPVVLELLSPAGRPVQVTSDLPGFWAGSYASVRKEMAGRYPKHPWPADPAAAAPPVRPTSRRAPSPRRRRR
jgi:ATP-dependent helicase HrpB